MKLNASQHFMTAKEFLENLQEGSKTTPPVQEVKLEKSTVQKIGAIITVGVSIAFIAYQLYEMYNRAEATMNKPPSSDDLFD